MTISATTPEVSYAGDNTTVAFPIPFVFDTAADLKVLSTDADGNVAVITTGFTVSGGNRSTGTLTFGAPPAVGITITILDDPEREQATDYVSNDPFPAESHEHALDRGVRISKRLYQMILRCLRTQDGDPASGAAMVFPTVATRRGRFALWADDTTAQLEPAVGLPVGEPLSQSIIGGLLYPQTSAESSAGVDPPSKNFEPGHILRYIPAAQHAAILAGTSSYDASVAAQSWLDSLVPGDIATLVGVVRAQGIVLTTSDITFAGAGWLKPASNTSGSVLTIGSDSPSTLVRRIRGNIKIGDPAGGVSTWSNVAGLTLLQAVECEMGLDFRGLGVGWNGVPSVSAVAYNQFRIGLVLNCKIGVLMNPGGSGYVNENLFIGGRYTLTGGQYESGCISVDVRNPTSNTPNNNRFVGPSFEGPSQYIRNAGMNNIVELARMEPGLSGTPGTDFAETLIELTSTAIRNDLEFSYNSDWLTGNHTIDHGAATRVDDMSFTIAGEDLRTYFYPGAWARVTIGGTTHVVPVRSSSFSTDTTVLVASPLITGNPTAVRTMRATIAIAAGSSNRIAVKTMVIPNVSTMSAEMIQDHLMQLSRCALYLTARGTNYPALTIGPGGSSNDYALQVTDFDQVLAYIQCNGAARVSRFGLAATPSAPLSAIAAPAGGSVIDAEARTAINSIRAAMTAFGFTA